MAKQTWTIPLEPRTFDKTEEFNLGIELDKTKRYEVAASSIYFHNSKKGDDIGTILLDIIDSTVENPNQTLTRISKSNNVVQNQEYYKIDKYSLKSVRLNLVGLEVKQLAITLNIREI